MRNFLMAIVLVTAVAIGVAFYVGWLTFATENHDGRYTASISVNTVQFKQAAESAEEKIKKVGENAKDRVEDLTSTEKATGTVNAIENSGQSFTLSIADERELTVRMDTATRVTGAHLRGVQVGDRVTVAYKTKDGDHIARSVTIE